MSIGIFFTEGVVDALPLVIEVPVLCNVCLTRADELGSGFWLLSTSENTVKITGSHSHIIFIVYVDAALIWSVYIQELNFSAATDAHPVRKFSIQQLYFELESDTQIMCGTIVLSVPADVPNGRFY